MKNQQQIFDRVTTHLLTQNAKAMILGDCMYRGANGLMCAIGCLIPDDIYSPDLENTCVESLPEDVIKAMGLKMSETNIGLLERLQHVHDWTDTNEWYESLQETATDFELQFNPPDQVKHDQRQI